MLRNSIFSLFDFVRVHYFNAAVGCFAASSETGCICNLSRLLLVVTTVCKKNWLLLDQRSNWFNLTRIYMEIYLRIKKTWLLFLLLKCLRFLFLIILTPLLHCLSLSFIIFVIVKVPSRFLKEWLMLSRVKSLIRQILLARTCTLEILPAIRSLMTKIPVTNLLVIISLLIIIIDQTGLFLSSILL